MVVMIVSGQFKRKWVVSGDAKSYNNAIDGFVAPMTTSQPGTSVVPGT